MAELLISASDPPSLPLNISICVLQQSDYTSTPAMPSHFSQCGLVTPMLCTERCWRVSIRKWALSAEAYHFLVRFGAPMEGCYDNRGAHQRWILPAVNGNAHLHCEGQSDPLSGNEAKEFTVPHTKRA